MNKILIFTFCLFSLFLVGCVNIQQEENVDEAVVDKIDNAMTYDDLYAYVSDKKVEIGMTPSEVVDLLGEPMSMIDTREDPNAFRDKGSIYGDEIVLDYDGFNCVFYDLEDDDEFSLSSIWIRNDNFVGPREIKIGMTKEEVKSKFPQGKAWLLDDDDTKEAWGELVYGEVIGNDFQKFKIVSDVETAYEIYPIDEDGESYLIYEYWTLNDEECLTQMSENAAVVYYLRNNKVTAINIDFKPKR